MALETLACLSPPALLTMASPSMSTANFSHPYITQRKVLSPVELPEIASCIASYLCKASLARASRINRTWHSICCPILYNDVHIGVLGFNMTSFELGVVRCGIYCQRLTVARSFTHLCPQLVAALEYTPNLLELEASWNISDLLEAAIHLQKLERLSVPRLQGSHPEDNRYFQPSFQGSKNLRYLDMTETHLMTDEALFQITKTSPHIQVLTVSGNRSLTHRGLVRWCEALDISYSKESEDKGDSLRSLPSLTVDHQWTELTIVNFSNCNQIESVGFEALFEHSRHLQDVNLMSTRVEDRALTFLADNNPDLHTVVLNCCAHMSDSGLRHLLTTCASLTSVSFLYCHRVTAAVFFHRLWKCLKLKELQFSLNSLHQILIEFGMTNTISEPLLGGVGAMATQSVLPTAAGFFDPHLEYQILGAPMQLPAPEAIDETDLDTMDGLTSFSGTSSTSQPHGNIPPSPDVHSAQEYRRQLILKQIYSQIERLSDLESLHMRDLRLPLTLSTGLWRLGQLDRLRTLEWTGLEKPLRKPEIDWLSGLQSQNMDGTTHEETVATSMPMKMLERLMIKGGYGMSVSQAQEIQTYRPALDIQLSHIRTVDDGSSSV
ncbi:hypothetical protein EMPS_05211 [Entomortierella parvispora]|uniref:F-box domain-containing protein n=1 Tax=Entomortierella parvispora TaxID=205924 RepID=A0A9P3HAF4_9FUNG|nr:hypothetical protein EMPS_05211 [Entomortierella parvispora]